MKVFHTFFCLHFIALQDGNTGLFNTQRKFHIVMEGQDITVGCLFSFSGSRRFLCKGTCEDGNILIDTTKNNDQRGRYSIEYKEGVFPSRNTILYVTIKQLKKSDSGRYRCVLGRSLFLNPFWDFELIVSEETSSSGSSKPPSTSSEDNEQRDTPSARSDQQLYVGLTLVVMIFILSIALLIFCKKRRSSKPEVPPVETNYAEVTKPRRVYEEIIEDGQSSSPPVEISSIYCNTKYTKPTGAEDTDDYSFVSRPLNKAEDDSSTLDYTEVDFSNVAASSLHSAPCGDVDNVLYSTLQMNVTSANSIREASPPLYSTVALHR